MAGTAGTNLQTPAWRAVMPAEAGGHGFGETFAQQRAADAPVHVPAR